ncbi:MAG: hypothetical protein K0S51_1233 [Bacillales bacterium]|jgi:hypothetical protein|nr:hypothetical protein [Bacillales bacterium]
MINFIRRFLFFISSLVVSGLLYPVKFIYSTTLISAILFPLVFIAIYQKYIFKTNIKGYISSILLATIPVTFGCLVHDVYWVLHDTGNLNAFFAPHPNNPYGLPPIYIHGTLTIGVTYSFLQHIKQFKTKYLF